MQRSSLARIAHIRIGVLALSVGALACSKKAEEPPAPAPAEKSQKPELKAPTAAELQEKASAMFGALPDSMATPDHPISEPRVALGKQLYFDARLSRGLGLSCNTCHDLAGYGVDTRPEAAEKGTSLGHRQGVRDRNAPSVYNAGLQIAQLWDGHARELEELAKEPILDPAAKRASARGALKVLKSIPGYKKAFAAAFPEDEQPLTYDNAGKAIGAFERTLVTGGSPFDKFVAGELTALRAKQLAGLDVFIASGCMACHLGPAFGGSMFQKLGLEKPYATADEGRAQVTGKEADKHVFKVPPLRNVAKTAPYFHDGSVRTLSEAVRLMAEHQTPGGAISDQKVEQVVAFLESLTGELPHDKVTPPELPPNGPRTARAMKD